MPRWTGWHSAWCMLPERKVRTLERTDSLYCLFVGLCSLAGKGSTCAFTESIIRHHGYQTGLFTSPHLISVRERIKLNGELISEEKFAKYFFECYDTLSPLWVCDGICLSLVSHVQANDESMRPGYFKFLTIPGHEGLPGRAGRRLHLRGMPVTDLILTLSQL